MSVTQEEMRTKLEKKKFIIFTKPRKRESQHRFWSGSKRQEPEEKSRSEPYQNFLQKKEGKA